MNQHKNRITHGQHAISKRGYRALFTADPCLMYYYTGLHFSHGTLLLTTEDCHLFVDGRYLTQALPLKAFIQVHEASSSLKIASSIETHVQNLSGQVGFSPRHTSYELFFQLQKLSHELVGLTLIPDEELFDSLRRTKDHYEKQQIQLAVQLTNRVLNEAFSFCTEGVTEKEVAFFIKKRFLDELAGWSFEPIVAFGKNSACPHWSPSDEKLSSHDVILIDCGALWNSYAGDMTRTQFRKKPKQELLHAYEAVQSAYQAALHHAQPGVAVAELYDQAYNALKESNVEQYFTHGLGHGVGLEIHEAPSLRKTSHNVFLQEGDVITIEPGVYLPGIGGIRFENTLYIGKNGPESFIDSSYMPF